MTIDNADFRLLAVARKSQVVDDFASLLESLFYYDCIEMGVEPQKFKNLIEPPYSDPLQTVGEIPDIPKFKSYPEPKSPFIIPDFRILLISNEKKSLCIYEGMSRLMVFFDAQKRKAVREDKECLFYWRCKPTLSYNEIKNRYCFTARIGILKEKKEILEKVLGKLYKPQ